MAPRSALNPSAFARPLLHWAGPSSGQVSAKTFHLFVDLVLRVGD